MEPSVFLEVENEASVVAGSKLSQLRCSRDGRDWHTLLPSSVVTAAGSRWAELLRAFLSSYLICTPCSFFLSTKISSLTQQVNIQNLKSFLAT